jgi:hypothetical protein
MVPILRASGGEANRTRKSVFIVAARRGVCQEFHPGDFVAFGPAFGGFGPSVVEALRLAARGVTITACWDV